MAWWEGWGPVVSFRPAPFSNLDPGPRRSSAGRVRPSLPALMIDDHITPCYNTRRPGSAGPSVLKASGLTFPAVFFPPRRPAPLPTRRETMH